MSMGQVITAREVVPPMTAATIDRVAALETRLMDLPQVELTTTHALHAGMYARTIRIPAGTLLTGALIRVPTMLIVNGHVSVFTGADRALHLRGYNVVPASAGRKQVFYAVEDTDLTMLFPTAARTIAEAEAEFTDEADKLMTRRNLSSETMLTEG